MCLHEAKCEQASHRKDLSLLQTRSEVLCEWKEEDGNVKAHVRSREREESALDLWHGAKAEAVALGLRHHGLVPEA